MDLLPTVLMTVVTLGIGGVATVCNGFVLLPFVKSKKVHSVSNHLILLLSLAEVAMALVASVVVSVAWLCPQTLTLLIWLEGFSVLMTTAIALDKVVSLIQPLKYSDYVNTKSLVILFWISFLISSLITVYSQLWKHQCQSATGYYLSFEGRATIMYSLHIPCVIVTSLSYGFVYHVARRHAIGIKSVRSVVKKKEEADLRHLELTRGTQGDSNRPVSKVNRVFKSLKYDYYVPLKERRNAISKPRSRLGSYGSTLFFTVFSVWCLRLFPSTLWLVPLEHGLDWIQSIGVCLLLCNGVMDPWLYAYHTLDLKPFMKRAMPWHHQGSNLPKTTLIAPSRATAAVQQPERSDNLDLHQFQLKSTTKIEIVCHGQVRRVQSDKVNSLEVPVVKRDRLSFGSVVTFSEHNSIIVHDVQESAL